VIEGTVTFKPLKAGYIAVELEVEDTEENLLVLSRMHKKKGHLLSEQEFIALPQDRFFLLLDIRTKCQQVQDLITAELEPIITGNILHGEPGEAPDEDEDTLTPLDRDAVVRQTY